MQALELARPIRGVNVLPPGQSGFLSRSGRPGPHIGDQIGLFDRSATSRWCWGPDSRQIG